MRTATITKLTPQQRVYGELGDYMVDLSFDGGIYRAYEPTLIDALHLSNVWAETGMIAVEVDEVELLSTIH